LLVLGRGLVQRLERLLRGLSNEEKERLFASLLPRLLRHLPGSAEAPSQPAGEDSGVQGTDSGTGPADGPTVAARA